MCIILHHEKTTLPIQDILGVNFYIWGHSFFSLGQVCVGKILNLYFRGKFYFLGGNFQFPEILNLCFRGRILFWGAFSVWGKFVYGKS